MVQGPSTTVDWITKNGKTADGYILPAAPCSVWGKCSFVPVQVKLRGKQGCYIGEDSPVAWGVLSVRNHGELANANDLTKRRKWLNRTAVPRRRAVPIHSENSLCARRTRACLHDPIVQHCKRISEEHSKD